MEDAEDEVEPGAAVIREAQALVGELMWVSGRSRPDIAYSTGLLSRLIHRRPAYVCRLAESLLKYLKSTIDYVLEFRDGKEENPEIQIFVDASFGPPHEQYRSVQGIAIEHQGNLISWSSTRQPFVAQSTAEVELLSYGEAHQVGESVLSLLRTMEMPLEGITLYGDNKAALTCATLTRDLGEHDTYGSELGDCGRLCRHRPVCGRPCIWPGLNWWQTG